MTVQPGLGRKQERWFSHDPAHYIHDFVLKLIRWLLSLYNKLAKFQAAGLNTYSDHQDNMSVFICNVHVDPLTPHFYIVKLGFTGYPYFCSKI